ncbi:MAG: phenylacetate-CoA oxygenase subunit PaaJ [Chitinophagaceae bacterium]|nr:phenylacetate-CoA oxygenase subunit PaaJ [Chitinophagaceae bacterium]
MVMANILSISIDNIKGILENVMDPEVPVLSVTDLGIIRDIKLEEDQVEITITPTYTGCPAMDVIAMNIRFALIEHGYKNIKITTVISPAWTTDWMTEKGKQRLREYGIAPPNPKQIVCDTNHFAAEEAIQCPHCNSYHTKRISEFGSTACKSLYVCNDCKEPFDYFKCH